MNAPEIIRWLSRSLPAALLGLASLAATAGTVAPPAPYGPVPTAAQLAWHRMEFYGFLHFGMNTFTDREWGYGDESPSLFNPTDFDADQIASVAADAGMKGLVLVCKHHDGFCLWPTKTTEHSVRASPWRDGKGDVVREIADACRQYGLKFGVYVSPWDRNSGLYGTPQYLDLYREQLRELLTGYGEVFIVWHDGANRGRGYYGGAKELRQVDPATYYEWPVTWELIHRLQPMSVIFSDVGPDVRWGGNEKGQGADPCWYTFKTEGHYPGAPPWPSLIYGDRDGEKWIPPECPVSIRPGWFYHPRHDSKVKSAEELVDLYFNSVGQGACLNLNIPPDTRGRIHERDVESLRGMRRILDATFAEDLAREARITASNTRGNSKEFGPECLVDGDRGTYWATDDGVTEAEVVLDFGKPVTFSVVRLREFLPLGQRVEGFALDYWEEGQWREFCSGQTIGNQRLVRSKAVTSERLRLRITESSADLALSEVEAFLEHRM
ncbi:MAG: alpha-L-fucosidase [Verrucomicrobiales bacterium]|nr:alpha-L-fucosidase [Verrucomicrobiales bacterium]